ncbi:MAG: LamG domain-containing protein [Bacilli bacterium]|nr:LamG domain-containing protein [Bacilli bacterium]
MKIITNKKLLIIIIISLYLVAVGISFAYFTANINGSETSTTLNVEGGTMNITYNGGSNISIFNIHPREEVWTTKTFTITGNNTPNIEMQYKISLVIESNTFSSGAIKYKLSSVNIDHNGTTAQNITTLNNINTGASTILLGLGKFNGPTNGNKNHTYNLEIYFPDTGLSQNDDQGKQLKAHIIIESDQYDIIQNGLLLWYNLNDKTNSNADRNIAEDLSGNGNNGTLTNFGYIDTSGWTNDGLRFDNEDDYISLSDNIGYTTSFSAFAWFKSLGTPKGGFHIIFGPQYLEMSIPTSGSLRVGVYSEIRYVSNHGIGLNDGNWHFIGFTFDGTNKNAYIDGQYVGTQVVSGTLTYNFPYRAIGVFGSTTPTYATNGLIKTITVYNRTLTAEEILYNYNVS